ncbi:MAG: hypothetical protein IH840_13435 [Candidatus Heimdallarchaeota archaeon]|nr:hypothetical protein [Candidatus Heimdallarchaeota archaeon]
MVDIPNYVTLSIEMSFAFLILWMDRRSREREAGFFQSQQEQDIRARKAQEASFDRFNSWTREANKRQIMLLESIMDTLGEDKVESFKEAVGTRYTQELSEDINDLQDLLDKREQVGDTEDPYLESNIDAKIDEISSGSDIISGFLTENIRETVKNITDIAKSSIDELQNLSAEEVRIKLDPEWIVGRKEKEEKLEKHIKDREKHMDEFRESRNKLNSEVAKLQEEIMEGFVGKGGEIGSQLKKMFGGERLGKGLRGLIDKTKLTIDKSKQQSAEEDKTQEQS